MNRQTKVDDFVRNGANNTAMTELLTAAQMRAIEQAAIDSGEVTGLELMERAGRGVVEAIFEEWPELRATSHRAVVLCGPGNNGGDGFVVARLLKEWGWEVEVFLYGDPEKLPPDARVNYERWGELGEVNDLESDDVLKAAPYQLRVDSLLGGGISRSIPDKMESALEYILFERLHLAERQGTPLAKMDIRNWQQKRVAIDVPTGLDASSGAVMCSPKHWSGDLLRAIQSDLTVTFHKQRIGHHIGYGTEICGKVVVADIGLKGSPAVPSGELVSIAAPQIHRVTKWSSSHKYAHGHALILSGGPGKTGAARLAARGALRIGAGLVTIGCPKQALWEIAAHSTAIMCNPLNGASGLNEKLEDDRLNALCLGPGMGIGADTQTMVLAALNANRATVLDADALSRFERNPQVLFDALHENCVLTPHSGEFKRLFPDIAEKLAAPATTGPAYSKVDATREAAARAGCTVLFKGPDTVIADQTGRCAINSSAYERAAPWLATAGSGDVLAGFITGLRARGFSPMQAAETGAWLHTECALSFGPGLIAEDLPEELPKVFRALDL